MKTVYKSTSVSIETYDIHFREINRKVGQLHMLIIYSMYFFLVTLLAMSGEIIDILPTCLIVLYIITVIEDFMSPKYKDFKYKNNTSDITISDYEITYIYQNVFGRIMVNKYVIADIDNIEYIKIPSRILIYGMKTYEIYDSYEDFENNTNCIKSIKTMDKSVIRIRDNDELEDILKIFKDYKIKEI